MAISITIIIRQTLNILRQRDQPASRFNVKSISFVCWSPWVSGYMLIGVVFGVLGGLFNLAHDQVIRCCSNFWKSLSRSNASNASNASRGLQFGLLKVLFPPQKMHISDRWSDGTLRGSPKAKIRDGSGGICCSYPQWPGVSSDNLWGLGSTWVGVGNTGQICWISWMFLDLFDVFWLCFCIWLVVSNIFFFHNIGDNPSHLLSFFQRGWNHQPGMFVVAHPVITTCCWWVVHKIPIL